MSKKERRRVLAEIWGTPTARDVDFFDEGNEIVVTSSHREIAAWWIDIFQVVYPDVTCSEKRDIIKLKPVYGVSLKLNKANGILRVTGKNHWNWFIENFNSLLEHGNDNVEALTEASESSVTRFLQLDKDDEEVQDLLDMIPEGGGIMGHDFIMRVWKSLVDDWCGVGACVYVVTPRIDSERLLQIMLLMIRNKGTGLKVTLVTPTKSDGEKFSNVMDKTKRRMKEVKTGRGTRLLSDVKMEWVVNSLEVRHEDFSTNFIAAFKDSEAEVLTTTAHFHKSHFHFNQKDNVCYNRLPTSDLKRNYLFPLGIGNNIF
ncbi:uncharacterized protein LOC124270165 [Haliotis rubra]|uniref:uncharacterized protein LOC124270165 n=1 Tax=Haliotis rubra TaxID=36100 RepID=UPI001EE578BB|nr:uncharacterized protein LOC124270165 [Haliotis rubra]